MASLLPGTPPDLSQPLPPASPRFGRLGEVAWLFLKLGLTAFGGPAAHIALMRAEVVERRRWLDDQAFLDLLGATNLIPGPNSTEMTIHLGYLRAGWAGLIAGGVAFVTPAMLIVIAFAWAYTRFSALPQLDWLLYGVKPVIIAVIVHALAGLLKKAVKGLPTALIGLAVFGLYFLDLHPLTLLFGGGLIVMLVENARRLRQLRPPLAMLAGLLASLKAGCLNRPTALYDQPAAQFILPLAPLLAGLAAPFSLVILFLTFLKIGAVLYGSGYVLLAFLHVDLVAHLGWLTDRQLIDAIAIGQVTPGPLFTSATFIGYLLGGLPGALLATLGIFLPSFVFVALSNPFIPRLRRSPWAGALLDGVNVASLGLMAAVTLQLGFSAILDPLTLLLAAGAAVLLFRFKFNSTWLIFAGALAGLLRAAL